MSIFQKILLQKNRFHCVKIRNKHISSVNFTNSIIQKWILTKRKTNVKTKSATFPLGHNTFQ
jgi:hypothetical protein